MNRIRVSTGDAIARIVLARPERRNSLDRLMCDELASAIAQLERDESVRVISLSAEGSDFCAGADLHSLAAMLDATEAQHYEDARSLGDVFHALHQCAKPTVAIVQGRALAGGAGLATACDMLLANADARFGYPEVGIGFVPAMAMTFLVRAVGEKTAFDLVATGRVVDAEEAVRIGLASRRFAAEEFAAGTEEVLRAVAKASTSAVAATKSLLHELRHMDVAGALELGARVNARARLTPDFRSAIRRFTEKR